MAEKEERITIHEVAYPCKKCSINCNKNDWKDCDFYQNYISGMTRQEAIEKMAKAICNMGDEETWGRVDDNYKHYCIAQAELALKALLGD